MDKSNGYEKVAAIFIKGRGQNTNGIGASSIRDWARTLPANSSVLDIGCGTGIPVSKALMDAGMKVCGVDASPSMVQTFKQNFPGVPVVCEALEKSSFFNRKFDAVVAWGLLFLLPEEIQITLIQKLANVLEKGGRLLFTAPLQKIFWKDVMTGLRSVSLGAEQYKSLLTTAGMLLVDEFEDEGENHYYNAVKI